MHYYAIRILDENLTLIEKLIDLEVPEDFMNHWFILPARPDKKTEWIMSGMFTRRFPNADPAIPIQVVRD